MSAWLCAAAGAAEEVWVDDADAAGDDVDVDVDVDVDCSVAELPHAPMAATAASAATPVTIVLVLLTSHPFLAGSFLHGPPLRGWLGVP